MTAVGSDGEPHLDPDSPVAYRLRYQEAFEFTLEARLITDVQGVILEANHAAASILGTPKEFLANKPLGLFALPKDRSLFYQTMLRLRRLGDSFELEVGMSPGGRPRDVTMKVSMAEGNSGAGSTRLHWLLQDVTEQRRAVADRAELIRLLVSAQEDERRRVARELHDSVGQLLSALLLAVRSVRDAEPLSPPTLTRLDVVERVADELGRTMHDLAVRLRPTALDDLGLEVALQALVNGWSEHSGVDADFQALGLGTTRLAPEVETALYRVAQEGLTNITKHASARMVSVVVERRQDVAVLVIEDDGVGFDPDRIAATGRLGLLGMRERVTLIGGALQVEAAPGAGTLLRVRVPIQPSARGFSP